LLPRQTITPKPARIEFEYKRHGTLTLIGDFRATTKELTGPTRTEADFASYMHQRMAASWVGGGKAAPMTED
jgi:hypothetical protein